MGNRKKHPPVCVDTTEELRLKFHVVKAVRTNGLADRPIYRLIDKLLVDDLIPV
jgi:hypothetical protein